MKKYIKSAIQNPTDMPVQDQVELAMITDDPEVMQELLDNPNGCNWVVKLAIADNRNVPNDILESLTDDYNQVVRDAAIYNWRKRK